MPAIALRLEGTGADVRHPGDLRELPEFVRDDLRAIVRDDPRASVRETLAPLLQK
ncbi:MAG: hypothetical protein ACKO2L_20145 [Planctomycetaceae bacterium]